MRFLQRRRTGLTVAFAAIVIDFITKAVVLGNLRHLPRDVIPGFFNLSFALNRGVSFSFLNNIQEPIRLGEWIIPASVYLPLGLSFVGIAASIGLVWWMGHQRTTAAHWGLGLIAGGALGNVLDRLQHGAVVDFLHVYYNDWHFPAFNVADSCITVGVALLLLDGFRGEQKRK